MPNYAFEQLPEKVRRYFNPEEKKWESVGTTGGELLRFCLWLYAGRGKKGVVSTDPVDRVPSGLSAHQKPDMRIAPSIIARSEIQVMCLSRPRFSVRIGLGRYGFINARRIDALKSAIVEAGVEKEVEDYFKDAIDEASWIADSMLQLPEDLYELGYKVLVAKLNREYDYSGDFSNDFVPFTRQLDLGGGVCAQATCFMALCLLPECITMGPSEISAKVAKIEKKPEAVQFPIGNLRPEELCDFYRERSEGTASAQSQYVHSSLDIDGATEEERSNRRQQREIIENLRLEQALIGYLQSGSPVHYLVSLRRMLFDDPEHEFIPVIRPTLRCYENETQAAQENVQVNYSEGTDRSYVPITHLEGMPEYIEDENEASKMELALRYGTEGSRIDDNHCVLLVGYRKETNEGEYASFLINDPASFPFLPVTTKQLRKIKRLSHYEPDEFIPVMHKDVKAYLLPRDIDDEDEERATRGLIDLAGDWIRNHQVNPRKGYFHYGDWWLVNIKVDESGSISFEGQFGSECPFSDEDTVADNNPVLENLREWVSSQGKGDLPNWIWFSFYNYTMVLEDENSQRQAVKWFWLAWDATKDITKPGDWKPIGFSME